MRGKKNYKSISRVLSCFGGTSYHLSRAYFAISLYRPTRWLQASHLCSKIVANANLFGLSTPEVCPAFAVASKAVVSYTTFSPLPCGGLFSVALSVSRQAYRLPVRKQVALCCPDFPLGLEPSDKTTCSRQI